MFATFARAAAQNGGLASGSAPEADVVDVVDVPEVDGAADDVGPRFRAHVRSVLVAMDVVRGEGGVVHVGDVGDVWRDEGPPGPGSGTRRAAPGRRLHVPSRGLQHNFPKFYTLYHFFNLIAFKHSVKFYKILLLFKVTFVHPHIGCFH